jgi:hypothetical protein
MEDLQRARVKKFGMNDPVVRGYKGDLVTKYAHYTLYVANGWCARVMDRYFRRYKLTCLTRKDYYHMTEDIACRFKRRGFYIWDDSWKSLLEDEYCWWKGHKLGGVSSYMEPAFRVRHKPSDKTINIRSKEFSLLDEDWVFVGIKDQDSFLFWCPLCEELTHESQWLQSVSFKNQDGDWRSTYLWTGDPFKGIWASPMCKECEKRFQKVINKVDKMIDYFDKAKAAYRTRQQQETCDAKTSETKHTCDNPS